MAGNFTGMDIAQVRTLAQQLDSSAQQINDLVARLTNQLGNTPWVGNDATQFRQQWDGTHVRNLRQAVSDLQTASQNARKNAAEQETASA